MELKSKTELLVRIFINIIVCIFNIFLILVSLIYSIINLTKGVYDYILIIIVVPVSLTWITILQIKQIKKFIYLFDTKQYMDR